MSSEWIAAEDAAALLRVSRATLYAYVSRGRLQSHPIAGSRARRYRRAEVERLAARHAGAHRPQQAARSTLDWGLPVLGSALTLIENGRFYYRGHDALELAETTSLEDIAALLWACPKAAAFGPGAEAASTPAEAAALLRRMVRRHTGQRGSPQRPVHEQLARAWHLGPAAADTVRAALVLCADHELNVSSFTTRCVASTGADLEACIGAGFAALSGPRHGGMTFRVEALWDRLDGERAFAPALRRWVDETRARQARRVSPPAALLPGFGHPLYPDGDPRAQALLARLAPDRRRERFIAVVDAMTGLAPALDFATVALRRSLALPAGAAFAIFAIARTVGWIAHAIEQREIGTLIRPRAAYVGERPAVAVTARGRVVRRR